MLLDIGSSLLKRNRMKNTNFLLAAGLLCGAAILWGVKEAYKPIDFSPKPLAPMTRGPQKVTLRTIP